MFQCIEQRPEHLQGIPVDNQLNLRDRVANLEAIIQLLALGGEDLTANVSADVSLHMPLIIQSVEDSELELHRLACLEASRGLLKTYRIMRSDENAPSIWSKESIIRLSFALQC